MKALFLPGLILCCCFLSCKSLPPAAAGSPAPYQGGTPDEPGGEGFGADDELLLEETGIVEALPEPEPIPPAIAEEELLPEPEDELPPEPLPPVIAEDESLPEPIPPVIAEDEPLPEPLPPVIAEDESPPEPILPVIAVDESPPEPIPPVIAENEPLPKPLLPVIVAEEPPAPPEPVASPPPSRIVRPPDPIPPPETIPEPPAIVKDEPPPPPSPGRTPIPLPVNPIPDLPARNPPTLTPAPVPATPGGVSSRTVRAMVGQTIEVPFRGTGWVYLGESASKRGIRYTSRRLDAEGQTFVFQAVLAGTYELKFYRQDFIRDYIINDVVTLIVEEAPGAEPFAAPRFGAPVDRGRVVAEPRWPGLAGETEGAGTADTTPAGSPAAIPGRAVPGQAAPVGTAVSPDSSAAAGSPPLPPPDTSAGEYLRKAREEYDAGHIPQAIDVLDQFKERFPETDEALWLYARMYEAPGPARNIRSALDCYRRLIDEYPQSTRYADARRRIAYLERYYITIQ